MGKVLFLSLFIASLTSTAPSHSPSAACQVLSAALLDKVQTAGGALYAAETNNYWGTVSQTLQLACDVISLESLRPDELQPTEHQSPVELETVLANGTIANINAQNNPDLFHAMRGGSNQFG
jgi:hypothetical protein